MKFSLRNKLAAFILSLSSFSAFTLPLETQVKLAHGSIHVAIWDKSSDPQQEKPVVVLLSGPTDNWNSDSAWFARLAPKLARQFRVIAIDRAGQVVANPNSKLGYQAFAEDMTKVVEHFNLKQFHLIAFASSNLSLNHYFAANHDHQVASVIMVDPDVLQDYAIARYINDAKPFKQNLEKYLTFIGEGKYQQRAEQKNQMELEHLRQLAGDDPDTDWDYVEKLFKARLQIASLQNLFAEIARYDQDLESAAALGFPGQIPLTIIDTDFEQKFITASQDPEEAQGLTRWKHDAADYYQKLTRSSVKGRYIPLTSQEHLTPFSDPDLIVSLLQEQAGQSEGK